MTEEQFWINSLEESWIKKHERNLWILMNVEHLRAYPDKYFEDGINNMRLIFDKFSEELPVEFHKAGQFFGIRIKGMFFPMIESYSKWYLEELPKSKREKRDYHEWLYRCGLATQKEIEKYCQDKNTERSYTAYAMALHLKGIGITKKGFGVVDNVDYLEKFSLPLVDKKGERPETLYKKLNDILNDKIADKDGKIKKNAEKIIKEKNL